MSPVLGPCPLVPPPPDEAPGDGDGLAPGDGESGMPVTPLAGEALDSGLSVELGVIDGDGKSVVPVEGVGGDVVGVAVGVAVLVGVADRHGQGARECGDVAGPVGHAHDDRVGTVGRPLSESVSQRLVM